MRSRLIRACTAVLPVAALLCSCGGGGGGGGGGLPVPAATPAASVTLLSSRPDMVSEGTALVRVAAPQGTPSDLLKVTLAGADVTNQFSRAADGSLQGVLKGLKNGRNEVVVSLEGTTSTLSLVNHDRNGPIISGPQQAPWICQTADFKLPDGSALGSAQDANCNASARIVYVYMPSKGTAFKALPSLSEVPGDVRKTTTTDGREVNYIVRVETGTLNRAIYQFAMLHDPVTDAGVGPTASYKGWNRKLIYTFGGSATAGYVQGLLTGGVMNDLMLSQGYAVISSTLNVFGNNANDVLSAETASMVKEKFIKAFGVPLYTMGWGSSGGAMQQHLIANNYPGLLDGLAPTNSWSDLLTVVPSATDCSLLTRAFKGDLPWSNAQKTAVTGYRDYSTCLGAESQVANGLSWEKTFSPYWMMARRGDVLFNAGGVELTNCLSSLPASLVYDPVTNVGGARCDLYSSMPNMLGIDPATGFAARPADNVGVQYGLGALKSGSISTEQFVELNERVGGYDGDGNLQAARTSGSHAGLDAAYAYGRVNQAQNLAAVPIIDWRVYLDPDIHNASRSLTTRQRIVRASGAAPNHVILRGPNVSATALREMDNWLTAIVKDSRTYPNPVEKAAANKPAGLSDACYTAEGARIAEPADMSNAGQCGALYPYFTHPRIVAGAPLEDDILKCQLKALQRGDYPGMSDALFARLSAVFTTGVCDFSKPGIGQRPLQATWLSYPAPGRPLALPTTP